MFVSLVRRRGLSRLSRRIALHPSTWRRWRERRHSSHCDVEALRSLVARSRKIQDGEVVGQNDVGCEPASGFRADADPGSGQGQHQNEDSTEGHDRQHGLALSAENFRRNPKFFENLSHAIGRGSLAGTRRVELPSKFGAESLEISWNAESRSAKRRRPIRRIRRKPSDGLVRPRSDPVPSPPDGLRSSHFENVFRKTELVMITKK